MTKDIRTERVNAPSVTFEYDADGVDMVITDGDGDERLRWPMKIATAESICASFGEAITEAKAEALHQDGERE